MKSKPIDVDFSVVSRARRWKIDANAVEDVLRLIAGSALFGWAVYCASLIK